MEVVETKADLANIKIKKAGLEPKAEEAGLELGEKDDEVKIVTKIVGKKPDQVDIKDSSGSEFELSDMLFPDSSNVISCSSDDLMA